MTTNSTAGEGLGLCAVCPVRQTCPAAIPGRTLCPVTGSLPPSTPPDQAPVDVGLAMESVSTGSTDDGAGFAEAASRGLERALGAVLGLGWTDLLAMLIERNNRRDADGNEIDWARLQLGRNLLCIAIAVLVPIHDGTSAAGWVARWLASFTTLGIHGLFAPAGAALAVAGAFFVGRFLPGAVGDLCGVGWWLTSGTARAVRWFLRSRLGWLLSRPAIWAVIGGVLIVSWRGLVYLLTGAS
jgi:hypothetical protein